MYIYNVNGITRITIKQRCLLNRKLYKGKTDFLSKHLGYSSNPLLYEPRKNLCSVAFCWTFFLKDCSSFDCRVNRLQTATTTTTTTTTTTARTTTTTTTTTTTPTATTTTITTTSSGQPGFLGFCNIKHRIRTGREEKSSDGSIKIEQGQFLNHLLFFSLSFTLQLCSPSDDEVSLFQTKSKDI